MAGIEFDLHDGLKVGETVHKKVTLREPTAGDVIDAMQEAERPVATPQGWQLVTSAVALGLGVMRRQVVSIGEHPGPLQMAELRKLSARDLDLLQAKATELEGAAAAKAARETAERGRGDGQPPAD